MARMGKRISVTEAVAEQESTESQETESTEDAATTATPDAELATLRKRLSGKDQALTASQQRAAALEAEAAALRQWKAEKEQADMSEVDRLKIERDRAVQEAAEAKAEAQRASLAAKFPLTFDLLGDAMPADAVRLAEIEARLKAEESDEEKPPRIDPNNPRRPAPTRKGTRTAADIIAEMKALPIPTNVAD